MTVKLLHHTPLHIAAGGARTCWQSQEHSDTCHHCNSENVFNPITQEYDWVCTDCGAEDSNVNIGPKDLALLDRVGNKFKHASILEHVTMNFYIKDISRACLQELARHRMASLSVKSSRYTLKELKNEPSFTALGGEKRAEKYLVFTDNKQVNTCSIYALEALRECIKAGISNDKAKYCMPEAYKTELTWSINLRSLQNFLHLRTDKSALWEIQDLARTIYSVLPTNIQSLLCESIHEQEVPNE